MTVLSAISGLFVLSVCGAALLLGILAPPLLTQSDLGSFLIVHAFLTFLVFLLVSIPVAVFTAIRRIEVRRIRENAAVALGATILAGFALMLFRTFLPEFNNLLVWLAVLAAAIGLWVVAAGGIRRRVVLLRRLSLFSVVGGGIYLAMLATTIGLRAIDRAEASPEPRHVLLLVLDGFTASHLNSYNRYTPVTGFDRLLDEDGLAFLNYRTNAAWTHGFFGILYSGKKSWVLDWTSHAPLEDTLLGRLQDAGVETRWITAHSNAMPESHVPDKLRSIGHSFLLPPAYRMDRYGGLRSVFVSENFSWVPAAVGLSYNVVLRSHNIQVPPVLRQLYDLVHSGAPSRDFFGDFLVEELKQIRGMSSRSFVLAHVTLGHGVDFPDEPRFQEAVERWSAQGKVIDPKDTWAVAIHRQRLKKATQASGADLERLVQRLKAEGLYRDTLIMVTGDHGRASTEGRFLYQYHSVEEVARVPMILLNSGRTGRDSRLFETIDIAQTLFDHFSIPARLDDRASSMLSDASKSHITYLTYPNPFRPEWFMNIYKGDAKYVVNFNAKAKEPVVRARMEGFRTFVEDAGVALCAEIGSLLQDSIAEYGLESHVRSPCQDLPVSMR